MSNSSRRDESIINRLSSFLYREGEIDPSKIRKIKRNVFYLETTTREAYILKNHRSHAMQQHWDFMDEIRDPVIITFKRFPNGRKTINDGYDSWTISTYIHGRKLNYQDTIDRKRAVNTVKRFHAEAKNIKIKQPIVKRLFYYRWYDRLLSFKKTEKFFLENGFEDLYKDIILITEKYLRFTAEYPWSRYQQAALMYGEWVHGDVASHNFIHRNMTYLIDFDLLACAPQIYDFIQLGQRFLPYLNWNIDRLLECGMVDESNHALWLSGIVIPSDVLREWKYFLSKRPHTVSIQKYLSHMEEEWYMRKLFLSSAKSMLKSI